MRTALYIGLGLVLGVMLAAIVGVVVVDLIIPWEDICLAVGPAQNVIVAGSALLTDLEEWLTAAEEFLAVSPPSEGSEARSGLSGLLSRATQVAGEAAATTINVLTAPLRLLIDLAQALVSAVQASMDAARDLLANIDTARC
jgi:hypothetical protein